MIITSTANSPKVPFQGKIDKKIKSLLDSIHPNFHETNPILSGSYLVNLLVAPTAHYSDYDFYFETNEYYLNAKNILSKKYPEIHSNTNCVTYNLEESSTQLQIINTYFGTPADIILQHDLENSKVAYQKESLYFTKKFLESWIAGEVELSSWQEKSPTDYEYNFYSYCSTLTRIKKYSKRYNLYLSENTLSMLTDLKSNLISNYIHYKRFNNFRTSSSERDYWTGEEKTIQNYSTLISTINKFLFSEKIDNDFDSNEPPPHPIEF